jgi:hypothetical protein
MNNIKRIFHHHSKWEDHKHGMYDTKNNKGNRNILIHMSYKILLNEDRFYEISKEVIKKWKHATEFNLSDKSRNRKAWLGHAACCYNHLATEDHSINAWHRLTEEQQIKANAVAQKVIEEWEEEYYKCQKED